MAVNDALNLRKQRESNKGSLGLPTDAHSLGAAAAGLAEFLGL